MVRKAVDRLESGYEFQLTAKCEHELAVGVKRPMFSGFVGFAWEADQAVWFGDERRASACAVTIWAWCEGVAVLGVRPVVSIV